MNNQNTPEKGIETIKELFKFCDQIRYVAIYSQDQLISQQRDTQEIENSSSDESDTYEELLVNPTLLKLTSQRGNIDCGGLDYIVLKYGNFFQLISQTVDGHISICLEKEADINNMPQRIFAHLKI